jgi:hypothetical protein
MSIVEGFGGMRVKDDCLHFHKNPKEWMAIHSKLILETRF